ncbi:MAG: DUF1571 domain-containing protein [Bacteroidetes bacterium]|nr:DUF1571 domain-containing protein [Bacteroidota bacterium]
MLETASRTLDGMVTLQCRVKRYERVNGKMESGDIRVKVNTRPHKVYVYNINPNEGTELLWGRRLQRRKSLHPPQSISLGQHQPEPRWRTNAGRSAPSHTSTGFAAVQRVLRHLLGKCKDLDERAKYVGKENWYGKPHDVIKITHPDYKFVNYTVAAGEDLLKIDAKLGVPSYKYDYFDVTAGQVIKVPTAYSKEMVLVIDPTTHLPVVQLFYDDKGLFEKYEYSEIKVNPRFSTLEFSEDNEAYGF